MQDAINQCHLSIRGYKGRERAQTKAAVFSKDCDAYDLGQ